MREALRLMDTLSPFDIADYLKDEEDIAAFLDTAMEEGCDDPAFVAQCLGTVARARSILQLSRDTGISREGLYKALSGEGNPSYATIHKVAKAMGLQIVFKPAKHSQT